MQLSLSAALPPTHIATSVAGRVAQRHPKAPERTCRPRWVLPMLLGARKAGENGKRSKSSVWALQIFVLPSLLGVFLWLSFVWKMSWACAGNWQSSASFWGFARISLGEGCSFWQAGRAYRHSLNSLTRSQVCEVVEEYGAAWVTQDPERTASCQPVPGYLSCLEAAIQDYHSTTFCPQLLVYSVMFDRISRFLKVEQSPSFTNACTFLACVDHRGMKEIHAGP